MDENFFRNLASRTDLERLSFRNVLPNGVLKSTLNLIPCPFQYLRRLSIRTDSQSASELLAVTVTKTLTELTRRVEDNGTDVLLAIAKVKNLTALCVSFVDGTRLPRHKVVALSALTKLRTLALHLYIPYGTSPIFERGVGCLDSTAEDMYDLTYVMVELRNLDLDVEFEYMVFTDVNLGRSCQSLEHLLFQSDLQLKPFFLEEKTLFPKLKTFYVDDIMSQLEIMVEVPEYVFQEYCGTS